MNILSQSIRLYTQNIAKLLVLCFTVILPFLILHLFLTNYVYTFAQFYPTSFPADVTNAFLMVFFFLIVQIPFIEFFNSELEGEEYGLKRAFLAFFERGFAFYGFAILFTAFFLLGLGLLVIPGVILFVLLFSVPYLSIIQNKPIRKTISTAILIGKKRFFRFFLIIFVLGLIEIVIGFATSYGIMGITNSYLAITGTSILLNLLFVPFYIALLTTSIKKWSDELLI
ncbi:hypothetical protein [Halalkalibacter urbisdiaboli]|uniref:hypothetical protein n=1 Tax=Halalkalibacter urbisdiaboli TaxID=1960589 RepID=UPI000B43B59B|nr:hypothetical protein [Halalkalibacter urbisdiaboli]